ncbi:choice-of-anchor tandem repeat GloVer-containing protein [Luteolibacter soli]|uniref:Choice-of-anchor tandem repeat GloVer-containing protein n=1 Tax=Luteolibacter soli TaxID=3135280 RepID=A0ABU9AYQ0_9BACT
MMSKLSDLVGRCSVAAVFGLGGVAWGQGSPPPAESPEPVFEEIGSMRISFMPLDELVTRGDGAFYCAGTWNWNDWGFAIFRIVPGEEPVIIHQFSNKEDAQSAVEGYNASSGLVLGADGALYGSCMYGGANGYGTIYRISADGVFSVVHDRTAATPGMTHLVAMPDGSLCGVASDGGPEGGGTLYRLDPNGALTILCAFEDMPFPPPEVGEQSPYRSPEELALGADGKLYGRFYVGGVTSPGDLHRSYGGLFRYDGPGAFTVLKEFSFMFHPACDLVATDDGFVAAGQFFMHHLAFDGTFTENYVNLNPLGDDLKRPMNLADGIYGLVREWYTQDPLLYRHVPGEGTTVVHHFSEEYRNRFMNFMVANDGMMYGLATIPPEGGASAAVTAGADAKAAAKAKSKKPSAAEATRSFRMKFSDAPASYVPSAQPDAAWLPVKATDGKREVIVDVLKNDRDVDGDKLTLTGLGAWEGDGSAEIISTPKGQRIRVITPESDPKSRLLTYQVSDGRGTSATGSLAVQSQAAGTFRGQATGTGIAPAEVTVVLGKNHTLKATVVLDGVSYSGKGLLDVDDTADVSLRSKSRQGLNLHLEYSRGDSRKVKATVVKDTAVRTGDCVPVVK